MDIYFRILLPIFLVVFFAVAMAGRSYLFWKKTGINPYKLGSTESAHDLIGAFFRIVSFMVIAATAVYSFFPVAYPYIGPIGWLDLLPLKVAGAALLFAALVWVSLGQIQMGASWRIGIDTEVKTDLVESGLFRYSRNPIFLGMRVLLFGLFLVTPNALTLLSFGLADALMQVQVRLEEEHMSNLHGDKFERYRERVRRWI